MSRPLTRWLIAITVATVAMGLLLAHAARAQEVAGTRHGAVKVATAAARSL